MSDQGNAGSASLPTSGQAQLRPATLTQVRGMTQPTHRAKHNSCLKALSLGWFLMHPKLTNIIVMFVMLFPDKVTSSYEFSFEDYPAECVKFGCISFIIVCN